MENEDGKTCWFVNEMYGIATDGTKFWFTREFTSEEQPIADQILKELEEESDNISRR